MPVLLPPLWIVAVLVVAAYLVGSLSPGWFLVRVRAGVDLRGAGSGATGATNVGRVLGKSAYGWVLALDALKGLAMVWAAAALAPQTPWAALAGPAVVAGHIWPVWLGFRGGKGAATYMGVMLGMNAWIVALAWIPGILAGLIARKGFVARAVAFLFSAPLGWWLLPSPESRACLLLSWALVLLAHRDHFAKHEVG